MQPESSSDSLYGFRRRALLLVCIGLAFAFVWYAWELILLAFAGFLLAIILRTFSNWVAKYTGLGPRASYAATIGALLLLVGIVAWLTVPDIISQGSQIAKIIPASLARAKDYLGRSGWGRYILQSIRSESNGFRLREVASSVADAAAAGVVVVVVGFYAGLNPGGYSRALLSLVPRDRRAMAAHVAEEVVYTLRWWLLGQMVPMVTLGVASTIGFFLLGIKLAFILGLITGVMVFVPYLGAILSAVPAILVALEQGPQKVLSVLILYLILHVLEGYILTPIVQKRAVRLLPILTVLSQLLMWMWAGLLGVAVATPLAAAGLVMVKMLYLHEEIEH